MIENLIKNNGSHNKIQIYLSKVNESNSEIDIALQGKKLAEEVK